jgi:lysophospholipase L1-like esterase
MLTITKRTLSLLIVFLVTTFTQAQMKWHDPLSEGNEPFVDGRAWNVEIGHTFNRLPGRALHLLPQKLQRLSYNSAGLSVRFATNATEIVIRYTVLGQLSLPNVVALGCSGVDLYATDANGKMSWVGNHAHYRFGANLGDTVTFSFGPLDYPGGRGRGSEYELYLPLYNTVGSLSIGVPTDADFHFLHASTERPIVVYGTSIAQGASASRPAMAWSNILQRRTDIPFVNLGFSGSAYMENAMFGLLSEIDARAYIIDCIPNILSLPDSIVPRTLAGIRLLRMHSRAPILLVEGGGNADSLVSRTDYKRYTAANARLHDAYLQLRAEGVERLYYLTLGEIGMTADAQIDATHPNDEGMSIYADAYEKKLRQIFPADTFPSKFTPCRQRRDGIYEWLERHNEVVHLNRTTDPEILMIGNSITHFWGGQPISKCNGGDTWGKLFGHRRVTNMGFGWDRIENVAWRLLHGEIDDCHPQHICLLIGVNNLGVNTDDEIVDGISALAELIRKKQPQAKLHIIKIYPSRGNEIRTRNINEMLSQRIHLENTDFVHFTEKLTLSDGSGRIDESLFLEGLHPNVRGYARIADGLKKVLK